MATKAKGKDKTTPATSSRDELHAVDAEARKAQVDERAAHARLIAKQKEAADARIKFDSSEREKAKRERRDDMEKVTVTVVVQTRKSRPVRTRMGTIECLTPTKVPRRTLRELQGLCQRGAIQLVIGELEKPVDMKLTVRAPRRTKVERDKVASEKD